MTELLTTAEVSALLAERGYLGRQGKPYSVRTVMLWCEAGLLPGAVKHGEGRRGVWSIPRDALDGFMPPHRGWQKGRKRKDTP